MKSIQSDFVVVIIAECTIVHLLYIYWTLGHGMRFINMIYRYLVLWLLAFPLSAQQVNIAVNANLLEAIERKNFEPCVKTSSFAPFRNNEGVLELFILCQALFEANIDFLPHFISVPNKQRALWLIKQGKADVSSDPVRYGSVLQDDLEAGSLVISQAIHNNRPIIYAFYTAATNERAQNVNSLDELIQLKAAIPPTWHHQIDLLDKLQIKYEFVQYVNIIKFIDAQRADISLMEVKGGENKMYQREALGIPMALAGEYYINITAQSEYYIFSERKESNKALTQAFNRGLAIVKENDLIEQAFQNMRPDMSIIQSWQDITPKAK